MYTLFTTNMAKQILNAQRSSVVIKWIVSKRIPYAIN